MGSYLKPVIKASIVLGLYVILLWVHGYLFGRGDLVQIYPLLQKLRNPDLYPYDLYVQHAVSGFPNERYFFLWLLRPFTNNLEWTAFIYHIVVSLLLMTGIFKTARFYLKHDGLSLAVLFLLFLPLYHFNLGENELYYGFFHPSLAAKAIGIWAWYYWINQRLIRALMFSSLSTLLHPVAGLQVFALLAATEVFYLVWQRQFPLSKAWALGVAFWSCTAGVVLILIYLRFQDTTVLNFDMYRVFYEFRNPHHYLPAAFSFSDWLVMGTLLLLGAWSSYYTDKKIFSLFLVSAGCLLLYVTGVQIKSETITTLQWFKSTIWLELFAVIALLKVLKDGFGSLFVKGWWMLFPVGSIVWVLFWQPGISFIQHQIPHDFPFAEYADPAIDISRQAMEKTPSDALFIVPCGFTEMGYFGTRSVYVDYKALTHTKSFLAAWWPRLQQVYGLDTENSPGGYQTIATANDYYSNLKAEELSAWYQNNGITHMVTFLQHTLPFEVIAQNDTYMIYQLGD